MSAKECWWLYLFLSYLKVLYDVSLLELSVLHHLFKSCDSTLETM